MASFEPGAEFPVHTHKFSEALTILDGEGVVTVEGRRYRLRALDCIHVPAGVAHGSANASAATELVLHYAFATAEPRRTFVDTKFDIEERGLGMPRKGEPEYIARFDRAETYPLADGTKFRDLFAGRFGSKGICGGYGEFQPGTGLPCHTHKYDESITIVKGRATCRVAGRSYSVGGCDTVMVPTALPHRFLNEGNEPMAMVWVYAGDEPERTLVDEGYCLGTLK
jgi:quercetin dioxygenase-like cupin family protein